MTVVSSKEFAASPAKYYHRAINEQVTIKRGRNMFHLMYAPPETYPEQPVLEPDEEFYSAISADEFKKKALEIVERVHERFSKK